MCLPIHCARLSSLFFICDVCTCSSPDCVIDLSLSPVLRPRLLHLIPTALYKCDPDSNLPKRVAWNVVMTCTARAVSRDGVQYYMEQPRLNRERASLRSTKWRSSLHPRLTPTLNTKQTLTETAHTHKVQTQAGAYHAGCSAWVRRERLVPLPRLRQEVLAQRGQSATSSKAEGHAGTRPSSLYGPAHT